VSAAITRISNYRENFTSSAGTTKELVELIEANIAGAEGELNSLSSEIKKAFDNKNFTRAGELMAQITEKAQGEDPTKFNIPEGNCAIDADKDGNPDFCIVDFMVTADDITAWNNIKGDYEAEVEKFKQAGIDFANIQTKEEYEVFVNEIK
jgi:hypothetical protein